MGSPGPLQEVTYTIPADKCGLVIGKGMRRRRSLLQCAQLFYPLIPQSENFMGLSEKKSFSVTAALSLKGKK